MEIILSILTSAAGDTSANPAGSMTSMLPMLAILVIGFVAMFVMNKRSTKKQQEEQEQKMNALRPGNKVKTVGGVCGIIVEINRDDNTFVMETGGEMGKSYLKFDMQAIYQTDAKIEDKKEEVKTEAPIAEETASETKEEE